MERAHGKAALDRLIGKAEASPSEQTGKIRFEKGPLHLVRGESVSMHQQHAAIPYRRLLALQPREIGGDLGPALACEGPVPRFKVHLDPIERDDRRRTHRTAHLVRLSPTWRGRKTSLGSISS